MDKPFFSIVMPVYNVENYIQSAIESFLNQSFKDFEMILVDDCTPDSSGSICDSYAEKDQRVSVIHLPKNEGLSNARNQGLQLFKGKYVLFIDSDDTLDSDFLEKIHSALLEHPAKVSVYGLIEEYFDDNGNKAYENVVSYGQDCFLTSQMELRKHVIYLEEKTLYGYAWNKVFDVSYLKSIHASFKKITLIEDILFNVEVFQDIDSLNILSFTPYHYMKRMNSSLTNKFVADYYDLHHKRVELLYNQYLSWNMCTDTVKNILADIFTRYIFSALQRNCDAQAKMNHTTRKQFLSSVYEDALFQALIPFAAPQSKAAKIMASLLKQKNIAATLGLAKTISIVKAKLPTVFSKAKLMR